MNQSNNELRRLKSRYFFLKLTDIALVSVAAGVLIYFSSHVFISSESIKISLSSGVCLCVFVAQYFYYQLHRLNEVAIARYLNQHFPEFTDSTDLLLQHEETLIPLQQIQRLKTSTQLRLLYPRVKLPHHIVRSCLILIGCLIVGFVIASISFTQKIGNKIILQKQNHASTDPISVHVESITITPPAYTKKKEFVTQNFDLTFPEGSIVTWSLNFSQPPKWAKLFFSERDSISLTKEKKFTAQKKFITSGFYQLGWSDEEKIYRSDFYKLDAIKDEPPKVSIQRLSQFTKLKYTELKPVELTSKLSDDYELTDAHIVATVSKGSGEGIKFHEEKLYFTSPTQIAGRQLVASRVFDLKKMGLEPGDELYFYVEAWDNKWPVANRNRTETFFIAVQDTATAVTSADGGLGVDLLPEYFRSQRQIIIDTEKLLRDKKSLSTQKFNSTSNDLGFDENAMHLRYGQFLGDEVEAGIGQEAHDDDVVKQYGHSHDKGDGQNLLEQKKDTHTHSEEKKSSEKKENPIEAYTHNDDNPDEATFFVESIKAKLKAAVAIMWDAELYLRLYQPEKSLPYQYKALTLLKEISNDSRIYVHRSGFEPAPLKEDKRLTADLSEVKTNSTQFRTDKKNNYPAIQQAVTLIEKLLMMNNVMLSPSMQSTLNKAGQELSVEALKNPGKYLKNLSLLKSLVDQQIKAEQRHEALTQLQKSFWMVLQHEPLSPNKRNSSMSKLDQEFLKSFEQARHE